MYHVSIWTFSVLRVLIHYLYGSVIKMSSNFKPFKINQEYFCLTLIKLPFFFFIWVNPRGVEKLANGTWLAVAVK